jgi:hypothetical protein
VRLRFQVAKDVIQSTPSILVVPLLCCLAMLLTNILTVSLAARGGWEAPLVAMGVVCAVALGAAMLAMLVQRHFHQTLLQVSMRGCGWGGTAKARRVRWIW